MIDAKLITLLTLADTKSYTKAAETLNLTQPAISQHIKKLEQELNVRLFIHNENGLVLTAEGETVRKYARRIQTLYANMNQHLKDDKERIKRLIVGVTPTAENNIMSEVFAKYANQNEGLSITIVTDSIRNLYNKLKTYEVDLIIVEGKINDDNYNSILLDTDYLALILSNNNPLSKKSIVTLNDLKKEKLILRLPGSGTRELFEASLESNNDSIDGYNVIMEVDNVSTIKDLVQHNFGVSILAKSACSEEVKKNKFKMVSVENLSMLREINVFYHKDFEHVDII